jgi:hypothetical protein
MNKELYTVGEDSLIYDGTYAVDAKNIQVSISETEPGVIKRGQVLDEADGTFSIHKNGGKPSCIVAEDTSYAVDDTDIIVPCYISGCFWADKVTELTVAEREVLRSKGIILK